MTCVGLEPLNLCTLVVVPKLISAQQHCVGITLNLAVGDLEMHVSLDGLGVQRIKL